jgi:glycogen phosphorylase
MATETESGADSINSLPARELPATLQPLERLAWNYWWSWAPDGVEVFRDLDPGTWAQCDQNPRALLAQISDLRLTQMAADPAYAERVKKLAGRFDFYAADTRLYPSVHLDAHITRANPVAYFCAEFGVHSSLPLYSGGLGILAGDHLKSASDLNLPLVAIGLFYRYGYFQQRINIEGWQEESYRENYAGELPLEVVRSGREPLLIQLKIRERLVHARVWQAKVGRVQLYLLDTNVPENEEIDRLITGYLYGGDRETRLVQEMMLGIGGVRLLDSLGIEPRVFHLNEGHSAFLTLELTRKVMECDSVAFSEAARRVREHCVFTTHTPVAAGHDEFESALVEKCFGNWYETALGLSREEFLALGRINGSAGEAFGLTPLALRMSRATNGVSRKHGAVSRALWQKMWPNRNVADVPITYVTNGVHTPTWVAPAIRVLLQKVLGDDWEQHASNRAVWSAGIQSISDEDLWQAHSLLKQRLVAFVRDHSFEARLARGDDEDYIEAARTMFDPDILTIGFARRVAGYKRWDLLLSDTFRLSRLINGPDRPLQIVFAGKAHPQDQGAKQILQRLLLWQRDPSVRQRVAFIEDYDQEVARQLVQGVDVWMNVPRPPMEASGTSGEKAAVNGSLNFSVLDGWWIEGYDGHNGFIVGNAAEAETETDATHAASLYLTLEEEIIPCFYDRDLNGIPRRWLAMMKHSIETLVPAFDSDRMVAEYAERIYSER